MNLSADGPDRKPDPVRIVRPPESQPCVIVPFHRNGHDDWDLDFSEVLLSDLYLQELRRLTLFVCHFVAFCTTGFSLGLWLFHDFHLKTVGLRLAGCVVKLHLKVTLRAD